MDIDGNIIENNRKEAKALMGLNYASFGLLAGTPLYGIADGWVYMVKLNRRERRKRLFLERQLKFSAMGGPGEAGLGMQLSF